MDLFCHAGIWFTGKRLTLSRTCVKGKNKFKIWKLNQRQLERAAKQPAVVDKEAPGLNEKHVRAGASRLLSARESTQARLMSRPQDQRDVTQLSQDRSKFPPAAAMQPVLKMGTFTAWGQYVPWKPTSLGEWCSSDLWLLSRWQQKEHRLDGGSKGFADLHPS